MYYTSKIEIPPNISLKSEAAPTSQLAARSQHGQDIPEPAIFFHHVHVRTVGERSGESPSLRVLYTFEENVIYVLRFV